MSDRTNHLFFHNFMPVLSCRGERSQIIDPSKFSFLTESNTSTLSFSLSFSVSLSQHTHAYTHFLLFWSPLTSLRVTPLLSLPLAASINQLLSPPLRQIALFYLFIAHWQICLCGAWGEGLCFVLYAAVVSCSHTLPRCPNDCGDNNKVFEGSLALFPICHILPQILWLGTWGTDMTFHVQDEGYW